MSKGGGRKMERRWGGHKSHRRDPNQTGMRVNSKKKKKAKRFRAQYNASELSGPRFTQAMPLPVESLFRQ